MIVPRTLSEDIPNMQVQIRKIYKKYPLNFVITVFSNTRYAGVNGFLLFARISVSVSVCLCLIPDKELKLGTHTPLEHI